MKSYFKRRSKPREIKPTGGIQFKNFTAAFGERKVIYSGFDLQPTRKLHHCSHWGVRFGKDHSSACSLPDE